MEEVEYLKGGSEGDWAPDCFKEGVEKGEGFWLPLKRLVVCCLVVMCAKKVLMMNSGSDMTGIIQKCVLLDVCSCEFGQAQRQRNKPEYGCLESHISPAACYHQK